MVRNVRPIRCEKIRYFMDPVFTDRLRVASEVLQHGCKPGKLPLKPLLDEAALSGSLAAHVPIKAPTTMNLQEAAKLAISQVSEKPSRAFTADDMTELDTLNSNDFSLDFSDVEIPQGELSDEQITALAGEFYDMPGRAA